MHVPHVIDALVGILEAANGHVTRVRDEEVDGAMRRFGGLDHCDNRRFVTHVDLEPGTPDIGRDTASSTTVKVGNHNVTSSLTVRGASECLSDARPAAGDDDDSILEFHRTTSCQARRRRPAPNYRSLNRWILPVAVLGSASMNS